MPRNASVGLRLMEEILPVNQINIQCVDKIYTLSYPPGPPNLNVDAFPSAVFEWNKFCQLDAMPHVITTLRLGGAGGGTA